jgi:hypothetical protein
MSTIQQDSPQFPSLNVLADTLVSSAEQILQTATSEEDLRIGFEKMLSPILREIGIESKPKYERSVSQFGRSDAMHGRVIIEYEFPRSFHSQKKVEHTFQQLVSYIIGETQELSDMKFLTEARFVGVGFDGEKIFFVQYQGTQQKTKVKLDEKDFVLNGVCDFDQQSARTLLTFLRALSRRLLTAENLAEGFGPQSKIATLAVSAFVDSLEHWGNNRVQVFFNEWKRLFGIVYGEQFGTHQQEEVEKFAKLYGVNVDIDFQELLFCVHTYFALLMKLIAAELVTLKETAFSSSYSQQLVHSSQENLISLLTEIEEGGTYAKRGITNFLEGDFFRWYLDAFSPRLEEAIREVTREFSQYEPATSSINPNAARDLLKKLYQYLVPQEVRHKLGEYYTPDWLAEILLDEVGYDGDSRKRFLDPACGSGTIIVLALHRAIHFSIQQKISPLEIAKRITQNVWGFDLNPLAVIASRTNYLFALGDLVSKLESFEIPVFLADAVLWPEQTFGQMQLGTAGDVIPIPTSLQTFFVPKIWIDNNGLLLKLAAPLVEKMVKEQYSLSEAMEQFKRNGLVFPPHENVVKDFYKTILHLEKEGKNGIWARFLKNVFAPRIAEKFDFVVGNPPWIRWGFLSQEYRTATLPLWKNYGLFSLKGHAARLGGGEKDFSMLFTYAAIDYYVKDKGKLGFLITQEVFKSKGAGEGFRSFNWKSGTNNGTHYETFKVLKAHDFATVQPFEGAANKTAAIIVRKGETTTYPISYYVWTRKKGVGKIPTDTKFKTALSRLEKKKLIAQPIGTSTGSWQTISEKQKGLSVLEGKNAYKARQGADTQPYGVFLLEVKQVLSNKDLIVSNLSDYGKRKVQKIEERIESGLVFPAISGADIERWKVNPNIYVLMTQNPKEREPYPEKYMKQNFPRTFSYLLHFKKILLTRSSKSIKELAERTEFYAMFGIGMYTVSKYKVVWKLMSNDIVASVISTHKTVLGHKLLIPMKTIALIATDNVTEAHYLCAIINSTPVREFIKSYSSAGRGFGTPSIMQHIGIPQFDEKKKLHLHLAQISKLAHELKIKSDETAIEKIEKELDKIVLSVFKNT